MAESAVKTVKIGETMQTEGRDWICVDSKVLSSGVVESVWVEKEAVEIAAKNLADKGEAVAALKAAYPSWGDELCEKIVEAAKQLKTAI